MESDAGTSKGPAVTGWGSAEAIRALVREWLLARLSDPTLGATAALLLPDLSGRLRPGTSEGEANASRFAAGLARRLGGVAALVEGVPEDAPPESLLARWRKAASTVAKLWDEGRNDAREKVASRLTPRLNPVWLAALADSALEILPDRAETASLLQNLREQDAGDLARCPLPPGVNASWAPEDLLFPKLEPQLFEELGQFHDACERWRKQCDPAEKGASRIFVQIDALRSELRVARSGWPVVVRSLARNLAALEEITDVAVGHEGVIARVRSRIPRPEGPEMGPVEGDEGGPNEAYARLAARLLTLGLPEAIGLAGRVADLGSTEDESQRRRGLFGCLASLAEGAGRDAPSGWRQMASNELMRIARTLPRCEILGDQLLHRPIGEVVGLVDVTAIEPGAPGSDRPRVTRVIQPGLALLDESGRHEAVIRARVRSSM